MKRAEIFRADPRDRGRAEAPHARLGGADGRRGRTTVDGRPAGVDASSGPSVDDDSTGGQKYLPLKDGSFLAPGLRADQAHGQVRRRKTDLQDDHRASGSSC